ncbi:unnamed protein product [Staurois parvus]|uniref:Uncharacterized protein n=1 Tax=Staurois parvus TaxID=386267 RepID=A0ABN9C9D4_9NEOB|nr:unnamed protein product [Staurois parvus]
MWPCGAFCAGTRAHSFEWTPVPHDKQGRSPCTSSENAARTGTSVPNTVAFSSAGGMLLEVMAPARGSTFHSRLRCGVNIHACSIFGARPHICEPGLRT